MSYMIQGGGSSTMVKAREWLYKYPEGSHKLLQLITNVIVDYLVMQVKAGAQVQNESLLRDNNQLNENFVFPFFLCSCCKYLKAIAIFSTTNYLKNIRLNI